MNALIKRFLVLAMALLTVLVCTACSLFMIGYEIDERAFLPDEEWGAAIYNDALTGLQQDLKPENFQILFRGDHCKEYILVIDGNVYQYLWERYTLPEDAAEYEHERCEYRSPKGAVIYNPKNSDGKREYFTAPRSLAECRKFYREIGEEFLSLMESDIPREYDCTGSSQMGYTAIQISRAAFDREGLAGMGYDGELPYLYVDDISKMICRSNSEDMVNFVGKGSYAISYNDTDVSEWLEELDFPQELIVWD